MSASPLLKRKVTIKTAFCYRLLPTMIGVCLAASLFAAPAGTRYVDTAHHFSLVPPTGWTINKELIPHYVVLVEPNKSAQDETATIGTYGEPVGKLTFDAYIKATREALAKQKGLTVYGEKSLTLGGEKAHSWRMHVSLPNQVVHENRQVFSVHNAQAVILTLTALPTTIKKADAAFDQVLASFHWESGANPPKVLPPAVKAPGKK